MLGSRVHVRRRDAAALVRDLVGVVSLELCGIGDSLALWDVTPALEQTDLVARLRGDGGGARVPARPDVSPGRARALLRQRSSPVRGSRRARRGADGDPAGVDGALARLHLRRRARHPDPAGAASFALHDLPHGGRRPEDARAAHARRGRDGARGPGPHPRRGGPPPLEPAPARARRATRHATDAMYSGGNRASAARAGGARRSRGSARGALAPRRL